MNKMVLFKKSIRKRFIILIAFLLFFSIVTVVTNNMLGDEVRAKNSVVSKTIAINSDLLNIRNHFLSLNTIEDTKEITNLIDKITSTIDDKYISILDTLNKDYQTNYYDLLEQIKDVDANVLIEDHHLVADELINNKIVTLEGINNEVKSLAIIEVRKVNNFKSTFQVYAFTFLALIFGITILVVDAELIKPIIKMARTIELETKYYHTKIKFDVNGNNEIDKLKSHFNLMSHQMNALTELTTQLNKHETFDELMDYIFNSFHSFIPYDRIAVAILSVEDEYLTSVSVKSNSKVLLGPNYTQKINITSLNDVIKNKTTRIINDFEEHAKYSPYSESNELIIKEGMMSSITLPLIHDDACIGLVFFNSKSKDMYDEKHVDFLSAIANALSIAIENAILKNELILAVVKGFVRIVESKDNITGNHIDRIKDYSFFIANLLYENNVFPDELNPSSVKKISDFSTLHDLGKVGISDSILNKPGKLTVEEFEIMKTHSMLGAQVLENMIVQLKNSSKDYFKLGFDITKYHHERFDGNGYPEGLKGYQIPLPARIVAIADVFDALTSKRPYKDEFTFEKTFEMILSESGKHFDPKIIELMAANENEFKKFYYSTKYK